MDHAFENVFEVIDSPNSTRLVQARKRLLRKQKPRPSRGGIRRRNDFTRPSADQDSQPASAPEAVESNVGAVLPISSQISSFGASFFDDLPKHMGSMAMPLLKFERDFVLPAMAGMESRNLRRESNFLRIWYSEMTSYKEDPLTAYAYLARIAADVYAATSNPHHLAISQFFRLKGVTVLRHFLEGEIQGDTLRLRRALLILLFADSVLHDREAMTVHVKMLKDVSTPSDQRQPQNPSSSTNLQHLVSILYHDAQSAALTFTRTVLDLNHGGWLEQHFLSLWEDITPILTESPSAVMFMIDTRMLDQAISTPYLRLLFIDIRDLDRAKTVFQYEGLGQLLGQSTWLYLISKLVFALGRFINQLVDLMAETTPDQDSTNIPSRETKAQAISCVCAILLLRRFAQIETHPWNPISRVSLKPQSSDPTSRQGRDMLRLLRDLLGQLEDWDDEVDSDKCTPGRKTAESLPDQDKSNTRLLIWALWTGALIQHEFRLDPREAVSNLTMQHARSIRSLADTYGGGGPKSKPNAVIHEQQRRTRSSDDRWFSQRLAILLRRHPDLYPHWTDVEKILGGFFYPHSLRPGFGEEGNLALWFAFNVTLRRGSR